MNFGMILRKSASLYRDKTAVVCEGRSLSYLQLYERSCRLANALIGLGLNKGDRVATLGDNMLETVEEIGALALAGLVRCPLYTHNPADMHLYMLNLTGARALIVQDRCWEVLAPRIGEATALEHVIVHGEPLEGAFSYDRLLAKARSEDPMIPVAEDDLHILRFSAGTTGHPKGIVHTTRGWWQMGNEFCLVVPRIEEEDAQLIAGPMSHASGLVVWPIISHGARLVIMPTFDPERFLELVERERCTLSVLVPTMIRILVNHPDARKRDLSSLKAVIYGAAPIAEQTLQEALKVWGNIMYQAYGQSESLPATVLTPRHHVVDGSERERRRLRSAGRPTPNSFVKILDDDGRELPVGEVGEITVLTPGSMKEIWNDPEATAERKSPEGWIRTRDLGYLDEDGFLYILDRKEDMIISGGFNIWPAEIENALCAHPAVLEAVVVGVPHEEWGETPKAVVVLRQGQQATEQELIEWCKEKIGSVKKPTSVEFRTELLPKTPIGKVLRRLIREPYWEGKERRVGGA